MRSDRADIVGSIAVMQIMQPTTADELIQVWQRSELGASGPDLTEERQAEIRTNWYRDRNVILKELPSQMSPVWVNIEEADLTKLYILPCWEWFLDTGNTFRLIDTAENLESTRELRLSPRHQTIGHLTKVDDIVDKLADYDAAATSEALILIAANMSGPYTIIDGTHRATALYRNYQTNMPWKGILIVDQVISSCRWHIASPTAIAVIAELRRLAAVGALR
jgi:hypothetical protein